MRTLVYDCFSGISGDMHIGAMIDLGVSELLLRDQLARLELAGEFELEICRDQRRGMAGTRATVHLTGSPGHHRHLADIHRIIGAAGYPSTIERMALNIFEHIAEAEARVHDQPVETVHFHEVGATDSIVDIVAAAVCLDALALDAVYCRTLELGGGTVRCAHGIMPVPAPATAEILRGVPCRYDGVSGEATTPTGAAILREAVTSFAMPADFTAERVGHGVGQKDFEIPNVLRVFLGSTPDQSPQTDRDAEAELETELNREIHANIDDMPAEAFQPLVERLLDAGARDVYLTPVIMKKSRPGTRVSVLCVPALEAALRDILFRHSSTIGVRSHDVTKHMLPREERRIATSVGEVSVKLSSLPDGSLRWKVEHDDAARIARETGRDYLSIQAILAAEIGQVLESDTPSGDR
jgi:uncharacterized protein (TIGR00299 family) protein